MTETFDPKVLQERVRADRHATSYPLIVIGAVGFHYASFQLTGWVPVTYGLPLAFVIVWALQWRHERQHGVGAGRDDALAIAFAVLLATALVMSETWQAIMPRSVGDHLVFWLFVPTAAGLGAIGLRQRNRSLIIWSGTIVGACIVGELFRNSSLQLRWSEVGVSYQMLVPQLAFLAATCAGLARYRAETAAHDS